MNQPSSAYNREAIAQYQAKLKDTETRLHLAVEVTGLGIFDWIREEHGSNSYWDEGMHKIFELDPNSKQNRQAYLLHVVHPEDRSKLEFYFQKVIRSTARTGNFKGEFRIISSETGKTKYVQYEGKHILNESGYLQRVIGFCLDISEQKEAELALQESERRYERIIQDQTELICRWRPGGIITFVNDAYCHAMGRRREDLLGVSFFPMMSSENLALLQDEISQMSPQNSLTNQTTQFSNKHGERFWMEWSNRAFFDVDGKLTEVQAIGRDITARVEAEQKLQSAYEEVASLKAKLEQENNYLQAEIRQSHNFEDFVYCSTQVKDLLGQVKQVAPVDTTVLILGETGTGKELIARAVHENSQRKDKVLVKVNCAALPRELIESELFGHEKGAFTGATQQKMGRFELAQHGTIFLDEVGEIPLELQAKLLRVLQEGEFERIGSTKTITLNTRIIAATNRDLKKAIQEGSFREDLYYRLHVFPLEIPPLRKRKEDIALLVNFFIKKYSQKFHKPQPSLSSRHISLLQAYDWPGNVRELENLTERALILSEQGQFPVEKLLGFAKGDQSVLPVLRSMVDVEHNHILNILKETSWKINGPGGAAEILGLHPSTLRDRMRKLHIRRPNTL